MEHCWQEQVLCLPAVFVRKTKFFFLFKNESLSPKKVWLEMCFDAEDHIVCIYTE
jgi:hypothetical protein